MALLPKKLKFKATVCAIAAILATVLLCIGKVDSNQWENMFYFIVSAGLGLHTLTDVTSIVAMRKDTRK